MISSATAERLDLRAVFILPLRSFVPWLTSVLIVTFAGYPGVVCVTPLAWLLALRVGLVCAKRSASAQPARRAQEAALAGAWFGFLQGVLFLVIIPLAGPIQPSEQRSATIIVIGMILIGMVVAGGLSWFNAAQFERRRRAA